MTIATDKLNFTVGPVMMGASVKELGACEIPYFRTKEFSALMLENERLLKQLLFAEKEARIISLTGSGTAGMEAVVMNTLAKDDKVLVINGGGFGARFAALCRRHEIPYEEVLLQQGKGMIAEDLKEYDGRGFTAVLVNRHETSTGVLYDMDIISDFCKRNQCFLIVDAISTFLADSLKMAEWGINVVITGSQKAYAVPPGLSLIALDKLAIDRVNKQKCISMYFDFKAYLQDGERGQTPFTPAVGTLIQLNQRLKEIVHVGIENEIGRVARIAEHFRKGITALPLTIASDSLSNAVTPLMVQNGKDAYAVFETLEEKYGIWVCPNGGDLRSKIFRVGHIGNLRLEDNEKLITALKQLHKEGIL